VGLCYEYGVGVALDLEKAVAHYQQAAEQGSIPAKFSLGTLGAKQAVRSVDDTEALGWLLAVASRTTGDDPAHRAIRPALPQLTQQLMARMNAAQIAQARQFAAHWK
jgi:TPR repeat protein